MYKGSLQSNFFVVSGNILGSCIALQIDNDLCIVAAMGNNNKIDHLGHDMYVSKNIQFLFCSLTDNITVIHD